MLEIKPCLDKPAVAAYCRDQGKVYSEAFYIYEAVSRGDTLAAALFEITSNEVSVFHYRGDEGDFALFDGVLRAGFHYAEENGIPQGFIPGEFRELHKSLFDRLSYPIQEKFSIANFFLKYKNCSGHFS